MPAPAAAATTTPILIPPLIHAVAGSLGGALALLLFYPLERARIEMQKQMSASSSSHHHNSTAAAVSLSPPTTPPPLLGGSWALDDSREKEHQDDDDDDDDLVLVEQNALTTPHHHQQQQHHHHAHISLSTCIRRLWERHELYRGVSPVVVTLAVSNFVFFYVNEAMKQIVFSSGTSPKGTIQSSSSSSFLSSYGSLLASCLAGIGNVLLTNPLWVANLRIATGECQYDSLVKELRHVAQTLGWQHLWSGTGASLLLVSNPVLQFFCYEQLKQQWQRQGTYRRSSSSISSAATTNHPLAPAALTPMHAFVAGALAKAIATMLTYPLQLAQTVLRLQQQQQDTTDNNNSDDPSNNNDKDDDVFYHGTWDCLRQLYRDDGPGALFTGMRAKLLQTVLTAAFTFLTYEQIVVALHQALIRTSTTTTYSGVMLQQRRRPASRPQPMR